MRRLGTFILLALAIGFIWIAGGRNADLIDMRAEYGLNQAEPLENSPPLVAFTTVALGGFRGLLVDALWMRLSRLQDEGKYFELVQLADWITKLEPRSAAIWTFQAWNLSYNISVLMPSPEDRWRWVYHGVELLRDDGLRYNRGSAEVYKELGWLYQHKIGSDSDQAHWYYKRQWYKMMDDLFKGPRPDYEKLASDKATSSVLSQMRERYKLDPDAMQAVESKYGPLDWRIPESQSVYWAYQGLPYARKKFGREGLSRMIFQSLIAMFMHGDYRFVDGSLIDLPDIDIYPYVNKAFQNAYSDGQRNSSFDEAYYNFLSDALILNFYYQRDQEAREIFSKMKKIGLEKLKGRTYEDLVSSISQQPITEMRRHRALALINSLLISSTQMRLQNKPQEAERIEQLARKNWEAFQATRTNPNYMARAGLPPFEAIKKLSQSQAAEM